MQYRKDRYGNDVSLLGFGCMRFTKKGAKTDIDKAEREILEAFRLGVNYYDTAYIYGDSEAVLGEIFARNRMREKVKIATKLPQYLIASRSAIDKYFEEALSRLRTDYIDYYLMHMLTDIAMWEKLKRIGILEWIAEKRKSGAIRNIGFSYHGNTDGFLKILNDYDWDMCQIQYNYFDEYSQAGIEGLRAAHKKGIPVVIMEPLRGGKLVTMLPDEAVNILRASGRGWSAAEWGLRWLYAQPEVTVVLSGMNSTEMVRENCAAASVPTEEVFTEEDRAVLREVTRAIRAVEKVGCTGCRYCMPCPKGVDIPGIFFCYNTMATEPKNEARLKYAQSVALTRQPSFASQCVACGKCQQHCPQSIPIIETLKEADRALRPWPFKIGIGLARALLLRKT